MFMKKRIYIDTSVAGGYFDTEFSEVSRKFFGMVKKGEIKIIISSVFLEELVYAPERVRKLIKQLPQSQIEMIAQTETATRLAKKYVKAKVVGKTSFADCLHIAIATLVKADILVSWNFRHIVNVERINGYNSVNLLYGHKTIDIRTPEEVLHYER